MGVALNWNSSYCKWSEVGNIGFKDNLEKTYYINPVVTCGTFEEPSFPDYISQLGQQGLDHDNGEQIKVQAKVQKPGKPSIAVIPLKGIIGSGGITYDTHKLLIDYAFNTPNLIAVLLDIDSPG